MTPGPGHVEPGLASAETGPAFEPWVRGLRLVFHLVAFLFVLVEVRQRADPVAFAGLLALTAAAAGMSAAGVFARLRRSPSARAGRLVFDALVLTAVLAVAGGSSNPFTLLYFVHVVVAAVTARPAATALVVFVSSAGYASLFLVEGPGNGAHHAFESHLQGMWIAFTLTAVLLGGFVSALGRALRQEREMRARAARHLGLTTLAAGAAHELGNPLGTIKLVAADLVRELDAAGSHPEWAGDARVILEEVERARGVLRGMASASGELLGEGLQPVSVDAFVASLRQRLEAEAAVSITVEDGTNALRWPLESVRQCVAELIRNALDARRSADVEVRFRAVARDLEIQVVDDGLGIPAEDLPRVREPFFTTKETGRGRGLGLFLAATVVEQLRGGLDIQSRPGAGTTVTVRLPRSAPP
ncbi:MAG: HAMP domain-containing sensor histidine kinase [Myxococcota bacterium]